MDSTILEALIFFIFPVIIHSKNSCPTSSSCMFLQIKYPFKLETDQSPKNCHDYINLKCNNRGQAMINLPSLGDFYVSYIDYYTQNIALSDPENCLPRRLMITNIFSVYPLQAIRYMNYTFYTCPRETVRYKFRDIECMSNSTNATIASFELPIEVMKEIYGCMPIISSLIPVSSSTILSDYVGIYSDLQLTWNVSGCKDCEEFGLGKQGDDSTRKWPNIFSSSLFIPSAVVLITFFVIACLLRLIKLIVSRRNIINATPASLPESATNTTVAPPQTTRDSPSVLTTGTIGIDHHMVNSKGNTELVVFDESEGTSLCTNGTDHVISCCSICLEEYCGKDAIRYLKKCGHYFHAECIDLWLQKNTSCPVCRTAISNFNL